MNQTLPQTANENQIAGVNERLLQSVLNAMKKGGSPAAMLQKVLNLGKDAAYRRLRGDVLFTLDELIVICNELDICLDSVICGIESRRAVFDLEGTSLEQESDMPFMQMLDAHAKIWKGAANSFIAACPSLPEFIILRFPKFSRFRLYASFTGLNAPYKEFIVPEQFKNMQTAYNSAFAGINSLELIFDDNLLSLFLREVDYFVNLRMLSEKEADELYEELLIVVDVLEATAVSGSLPGTRNSVNMYLSHAGIGTEIWLLESNLHNCTAWLSLYPGKSIRTQNEKICRSHKTRIDEIKRFSTYITRRQ